MAKPRNKSKNTLSGKEDNERWLVWVSAKLNGKVEEFAQHGDENIMYDVPTAVQVLVSRGLTAFAEDEKKNS